MQVTLAWSGSSHLGEGARPTSACGGSFSELGARDRMQVMRACLGGSWWRGSKWISDRDGSLPGYADFRRAGRLRLRCSSGAPLTPNPPPSGTCCPSKGPCSEMVAAHKPFPFSESLFCTSTILNPFCQGGRTQRTLWYLLSVQGPLQ